MAQETPRQEAPRQEAPLEAAPSPAVMEQAEFRILLCGLNIDPEAEERIAQAIHGAVLRQLSTLGHQGKFMVTPMEHRAQARPLLGESSRLIGIIVEGSQEA
jgi:hypothetical protein